MYLNILITFIVYEDGNPFISTMNLGIEYNCYKFTYITNPDSIIIVSKRTIKYKFHYFRYIILYINLV